MTEKKASAFQPVTVTLKALRDAGACVRGYNRAVRAAQGMEFTESDEELREYIPCRITRALPLSTAPDWVPLGNLLWALSCAKRTDVVNGFTQWCADSVAHLRGKVAGGAAAKAAEVARSHAYADARSHADADADADAYAAACADAYAAAYAAAAHAAAYAYSAAAHAAAYAARNEARARQRAVLMLAFEGKAPWQISTPT